MTQFDVFSFISIQVVLVYWMLVVIFFIPFQTIPSSPPMTAPLLCLPQIAYSLAVAEEALEFEHRDLHWGNVLVAPTSEAKINFKLSGETFTLNSYVSICSGAQIYGLNSQVSTCSNRQLAPLTLMRIPVQIQIHLQTWSQYWGIL